MRGARDHALDVLRRVFTQGAFASSALRASFDRDSGVSAPDRGLATELVYGVLRRRGHLDRALGRTGRRLKDVDPRLHDILRIGAYQLMFLDRVPPHAAVSEAVEQAKRRLGPRGGGQVNAILRKLSDTPPEGRLPELADPTREPARHVAEAGSVPLELANVLVGDLGFERALGFVKACLEPAPLTLRTNARVATRDAIAAETGGEPGLHPLSVRLPPRGGSLPSDLLVVAEGRATPQDEASMRVVDLLDPRPGERVLDVCSAPGGKTTYIAERMDDRGRVLAYDRLPDRLLRVPEQARRLGLGIIETIPILPSVDEPLFDRVLVDAPCSGLGTLRRHPEIRWRFQASQLQELARIQSGILAEAARLVRPGGVLVYSVCTVTRAEGEAHVGELEGFDHEATLRTSPDEPGAPDGFFAARLSRAR